MTMRKVGDNPHATSERRRTVLIMSATDSLVHCLACADAIVARGDHVKITRDPGEALAKAISQHPDLVLVDDLARTIDGVDIVQRLHDDERTRDIPVRALRDFSAERVIGR
jgi:CheY-like chemotaxis protein